MATDDGFMTWTFGVPKDAAETKMLIWFLIFGELEIGVEEASSFRVQVSVDGETTTVNIHHGDAETLVRLTEAFYERRWKTWPPYKMAQALLKSNIRFTLTHND